MNESPYQVLDARQIKRIEAVHDGFPYQHLHAVGSSPWHWLLRSPQGVDDIDPVEFLLVVSHDDTTVTGLVTLPRMLVSSR